jgi:hypothetical protein
MKFFDISKRYNRTHSSQGHLLTHLKVFVFAISILLLVHPFRSHGSLSGWICKDIETKHKALLSQDVYNELIENIEWDMGQDTLRGELANENQKIMSCIFDGGFNYDNLMKCVGDNYEKVIEAYHYEFDSTRHKFEDSILNALKYNDYHKIAAESFETLETELKESLKENCNPERALNDFEKAVVGVVPADLARLEDLKKKTHGHYLVYLSFKRLIKAYILLTISCIQDFIESSHLPMPREFNYRLYSESTLDEMFPEDEITKIYTKKTEGEEGDDSEKSDISFNESMYKQGKYRNIVAFHIATGQVDPGVIDESKTPKEIYHEVVVSKDFENHDERLV